MMFPYYASLFFFKKVNQELVPIPNDSDSLWHFWKPTSLAEHLQQDLEDMKYTAPNN